MALYCAGDDAEIAKWDADAPDDAGESPRSAGSDRGDRSVPDLPQPAAATVHSDSFSGGAGVADAAEAAMAKRLPGNDGAKVLGKRRKEPEVQPQLRTYLVPLCTGMLAAKPDTGLTQGRVGRQLRIHAEQYQRLAETAAVPTAADLAAQFRDLAGAIPGSCDEFVALCRALGFKFPTQCVYDVCGRCRYPFRCGHANATECSVCKHPGSRTSGVLWPSMDMASSLCTPNLRAAAA